jgi:cyclopropane fatty-acyl-phospholipid synthase-like methyltransferase
MLGIFLYLSIVIASALAAYYLGLLNGALYIPTDRALTEKMLDAAGVTAEDHLVDIGSGDGRLVIAAAKRGATAKGYEINPILVWLSNRKIKEEGLAERASVEWRDMWSADLSPYSVVTVFGIAHIMKRLERKLGSELKPGTRVICNLFPLPTWEGKKSDGAFIYIKQ